jgi:hypothetical protein
MRVEGRVISRRSHAPYVSGHAAPVKAFRGCDRANRSRHGGSPPRSQQTIPPRRSGFLTSAINRPTTSRSVGDRHCSRATSASDRMSLSAASCLTARRCLNKDFQLEDHWNSCSPAAEPWVRSHHAPVDYFWCTKSATAVAMAGAWSSWRKWRPGSNTEVSTVNAS